MKNIGALPRVKKDQVITIRLTMKDIRLLHYIAQNLEMDRSDLVRMYIRKNNNYYVGLMKTKSDPAYEINTDNYSKWGYVPQDVDIKK